MSNGGQAMAPGAALVTGAGKRIGRAIALALADAGWAVAVHYRSSKEPAAAVADEIGRRGGKTVVLGADLGREAEAQALVPRARETLGPLTCLVNNAAAFERDEADSATRESWDLHMEANLRAPFVLMQALAAQLPADAHGCVVNMLDERVWNLTPHFVSYSVSKAGLWALTRSMALALAPRIRVNGIGPGPTLPSPRQTEAEFARQCAMMPLGHGTTPDEIARAVLFILESPALTGQMLALDGGQHLAWAQARQPSSVEE